MEDGIEFGVEFLFHAGILGKEMPGPAEGDGGGFVASDEKGHDFIAKLLRVHAAALLVGGSHEEGEEIGLRGFAGGEALAAGFDNSVDERIKIFVIAVGGAIGASGPVRRNFDGRAHAANLVAHETGDGFADGLSLVSELRTEESADGNFESEGHHFFGHVAAIAIAPILNVREGLIGHGVGVFGDALAVKSGLSEAALLEPQVAFGSQEAFAEEALSSVSQAGAFFEFLGLADEDFFDEIGGGEEDARLKEERKVDDITVFAGEVGEEAGGVAEKFGGAADDGPTARARRLGTRVRGGVRRFGGESFGLVSRGHLIEITRKTSNWMPQVGCVKRRGKQLGSIRVD